jgi:DNA-binding response OmpR family regulator
VIEGSAVQVDSAERPRILVVDDEPSARETIEALLHADHYQLDFATNGVDALARLDHPPPDLIICDVMMPGLDGFEVCRRLKAHAQWQFIPIVLVTALDGDDDMVRGLEAGADEFLSKPVERIVLRARVRVMLRIRTQYLRLRGRASDLAALLRARRDQIADEAKLTMREREVLELLLLGRTHEEIGLAIGLTTRTAKFHQANILRKLGAASRLDLMRIFS